MTIRKWMDQRVTDTKTKLKEEELDCLKTRVYNSPALDEESERTIPTTSIKKPKND